MRESKIKKYNIYKYAIIFIYIFNNNNKVILIRREIHIIDDLSIKIFININIIKSETIIFDIDKNLVIINFYDSF